MTHGHGGRKGNLLWLLFGAAIQFLGGLGLAAFGADGIPGTLESPPHTEASESVPAEANRSWVAASNRSQIHCPTSLHAPESSAHTG